MECSQKPLGYLIVDGCAEPVFSPIPGFEHMFARVSGVVQGANKSSKKRQRRVDERRFTFNIGDVESLRTFYETRFKELNIVLRRDLVTRWVKRREPQRIVKYGCYKGHGARIKDKQPPWWPNVPYVEPGHLLANDLVTLAVDLLMIHRRIDEPKREDGSWIDKLRQDADYYCQNYELRQFSSSTNEDFCGSMKKRVIDEVIPSLFNTAKYHEEYIAQHELYEGTGNKDPGYGNNITWQSIQPIQRTVTTKRIKPSSKTKVNEEADRSSSALLTFDSTQDFKQLGENISDKSSLAPRQDLPQSSHRSPFRTLEGAMVSYPGGDLQGTSQISQSQVFPHAYSGMAYSGLVEPPTDGCNIACWL